MILGIDPEHPDFDPMRERFTDLNRSLELYLPVPGDARDSYAWLSQEVAALVAGLGPPGATGPAKPVGSVGTAGQVGEASEDVHTSSVIGYLVATNPSAAGGPTTIGNLVLMMKEGSIMVRGLLRWIIKMLADHPEEVIRMREVATDASAFDARVAAFVTETIRLYESPYLYRRVETEVTAGGFRIPEGWLVRLCLTEAHGRPDIFPEPRRFDPDRHLAGGVNDEHLCAFGSGDRSCPGRDIAVEIARAVVRESAIGYDLSTLDDGAAWRINRHWGLWRPSLRLRISVRERA